MAAERLEGRLSIVEAELTQVKTTLAVQEAGVEAQKKDTPRLHRQRICDA